MAQCIVPDDRAAPHVCFQLLPCHYIAGMVRQANQNAHCPGFQFDNISAVGQAVTCRLNKPTSDGEVS
jgi:hypothetical protein